MKKYLKEIFKILFSGIISVALVSLFCLFYSYDGCSRPNQTGATLFSRYPYQFTSNLKEGFSIKRADQNGFYNESDAIDSSPEILIMGDSHMEATQIGTKYSAASLLNQHYSTYNIGVSEHELDYTVSNLENAIKTFMPQKYVITSYSNLTEERMNAVLSGNVKTFPQKGMVYRFLSTYVPLVAVLKGQAFAWFNASSITPQYIPVSYIQEDISTPEKLSSTYEETLDKFLEKAKTAADNGNIKLIIFRMFRFQLDESGDFVKEDPLNAEAVQTFARLCKKHGIIFLDMKSPFEESYKETYMLPFGFNNSVPGMGHLNANGHRIIAEELLNTINHLEGK